MKAKHITVFRVITKDDVDVSSSSIYRCINAAPS